MLECNYDNAAWKNYPIDFEHHKQGFRKNKGWKFMQNKIALKSGCRKMDSDGIFYADAIEAFSSAALFVIASQKNCIIQNSFIIDFSIASQAFSPSTWFWGRNDS